MLFSQFAIKNVNLRNRIVMPPMCMDSADANGIAAEWHKIHYASRAYGGAGMIIIEATAVAPAGRISENDLGLWDDRQIENLSAVANAVKAGGAVAGIQINHAGRKSCDSKPIAPSPIAFPGYPVPHPTTEKEINRLVKSFREAAVRAAKAGFDLIEIHAAHGYLINEFISPLTNRRRDRYGGSEDNRLRFLTEILTAVKAALPEDKILAIRISADEYAEGGLKPEDYGRILNRFKNDIDLVDVSTGAVVKTAINSYPGYQLPAAGIIKKQTGLPVIGGGLITDGNLARYALADNLCDLVYFGRELLRNPYFPQNEGAKADIALYPRQYKRAY